MSASEVLQSSRTASCTSANSPGEAMARRTIRCSASQAATFTCVSVNSSNVTIALDSAPPLPPLALRAETTESSSMRSSNRNICAVSMKIVQGTANLLNALSMSSDSVSFRPAAPCCAIACACCCCCCALEEDSLLIPQRINTTLALYDICALGPAQILIKL